MAIYDNFPWTSIHELNLGWIIEQVKAGNIKIEGFEEALEQFEEDYDTLSALAAAFTIAGSNISTTKNFSAASLSGPLTGNVTGNLTGNVTGNVTGDVTGNADTATYATSAGSATNATNATNATYATTAGSATTATSATSATTASTAGTLRTNTAYSGTDMDNYIDTSKILTIFNAANTYEHVPGNEQESEPAVIIAITASANTVLQLAWWYNYNGTIWYRTKESGTWQNWAYLATGI